MHMLSKSMMRDDSTEEDEQAVSASLGKRVGQSADLPLADHWTPSILLERAEQMRRLALRGTGSFSEMLSEHPRHFTMLSFRSSNGVVEFHENFADLFVVLDGRATLVTGGTMVGAVETDPGEKRGVSIKGGKRQVLRSGDVAHVPAGLPHQMLIANGDTFTAFVMKIREKETAFAEEE